MPYIIMRRTDIPDGTLQVVDLKPNTSQKHGTIDPGLGQSGYVKNIALNQTVATTGAGPILTLRNYCGLGAYLIDHVENAAAGEALTAAQANTASAAIILRAQLGQSLTLANIDAALVAAGAGAGTGLAAGNSTGSLADVLSILQGSKYMLPGGSQVEDAGNLFDPTVHGSFEYRTRVYYKTGDFNISNGAGILSRLKSPDFEHLGYQAPAVAVYANDGSLL